MLQALRVRAVLAIAITARVERVARAMVVIRVMEDSSRQGCDLAVTIPCAGRACHAMGLPDGGPRFWVRPAAGRRLARWGGSASHGRDGVRYAMSVTWETRSEPQG
ncbi:hypothetical protein MANAM107_08770 [Actinomyces capricornis]|uniref:Secreted protein n=1 Tax=Actinomyces capricornis TaxID=2755559 RepID=A0ABN6K395_9ACTO|nr:hypothetical protein MANAM107_08770 [Actinomyces capricornis]